MTVPTLISITERAFANIFESSNIIIGSKISDGQVFNYENGTAIYFDMTVEATIRCENQPFTVEARFPANYREKSLRGAEVKYDVYFESAVVFDTPEYNEQFITETLKMTAEALEGFEGETLLDKHRAYLFAEAVAENERIREELIEEAVWERFKAVVTLKKSLPQSEVESACELYYEEMYLEYLTKYSAAYSSFDEYAFARYGTDDIQSLIKSEAESLVFQNIIVYYMIREEKLLPSEENYEKIYAEITGEHLDYYASSNYAAELSKITDEAEKEKRISEIESEMMDYYGEDYFRELVYYANAYTNIISYANIIEIQ